MYTSHIAVNPDGSFLDPEINVHYRVVETIYICHAKSANRPEAETYYHKMIRNMDVIKEDPS